MGSPGPELNEAAVLEGMARGYGERLEIDRELYADIMDVITDLRIHAAATQDDRLQALVQRLEDFMAVMKEEMENG